IRDRIRLLRIRVRSGRVFFCNICSQMIATAIGCRRFRKFALLCPRLLVLRPVHEVAIPRTRDSVSASHTSRDELGQPRLDLLVGNLPDHQRKAGRDEHGGLGVKAGEVVGDRDQPPVHSLSTGGDHRQTLGGSRGLIDEAVRHSTPPFEQQARATASISARILSPPSSASSAAHDAPRAARTAAPAVSPWSSRATPPAALTNREGRKLAAPKEAARRGRSAALRRSRSYYPPPCAIP